MVYNWEIEGLDTTESGGVVRVYWKYLGTDDNGRTSEVSKASTFVVDDSSEGYIPFDELTEADVLGWVQTAMSGRLERLQQRIQREIESQNITNVAPPWSS